MRTLDLTIDFIQGELEARIKDCPRPLSWPVQNNLFDDATRFIYETPKWADLLRRLPDLDEELRNTAAINRWFNFWSARAIEMIFAEHPRVSPLEWEYQKEFDFCIDDIPFDHKTSVYPRRYFYPFEYAQAHPRNLMQWLYLNQSTGQRFKINNRIFLVLYDPEGEAWKLRASLALIRRIVHGWLDRLDLADLADLEVREERVLAGIVWISKQGAESVERRGIWRPDSADPNHSGF